MSKQFKIAIPSPCHERWIAMTPAEKGRFCGSCQKLVHDFTRSSDREIATMISQGNIGCGRFLDSQLEREISFTAERQKNYRLAATMTVISLLAAGTGSAMAQKAPIYKHTKKTSPGKPNTVFTGRVLDQDGNPLPGAVVVGKTSGTATTTDIDGSFSVHVKRDEDLELSFPGLKSQIITFTDQTFLNIYLYDSDELIENTVETCRVKETTTTVGLMVILNPDTIEKKRTFFGRVFHSIGNIFR